MSDWRKRLAETVTDVETQFDRLKAELQERLEGDRPLHIVPYCGMGSADQFYLRGRVLAGYQRIRSMQNDRLWQNLLNTYRRLETDEVPFARVQAEFHGVRQAVTADEEGYFEITLHPQAPLPAGQLWHAVHLSLLRPESPDGPREAMAQVLTPPQQARFGVVSDLDDTVIQTHVKQLARMARTVFLGNARTRLPFPGVAAFYRALGQGTRSTPLNPLFYVSSSPWNLYDLLLEFFELQDIPQAPMFLRDWGINAEELAPTEHSLHKLEAIERIFSFYPELPFILIGDSGQQDPEIYHEVVQRHPGRVHAVYIRAVDDDVLRRDSVIALAEEVTAAGSTLILAPDTLTMARHAADRGWINRAALNEIQTEKLADTGSSPEDRG